MRKLSVLAIFGFFTLFAQTAIARDIQSMIVAGGCFWCVESDFESVPGIKEVVSGYTGGNTEDPTYRTLKGSGHYEAVKITYDADKVSYDKLLNLFFRSIDPTDAGGQFCDRGHAYKTAIFVSNEAEKKSAQNAKSDAQTELGRAIVTPILPAAQFYDAEAYHQDYYKSKTLVVTRFGPLTKANAYKRYRKACGRDARVQELWGADAPFVRQH